MRIISSLILYFIFSFAYGQSAKEVLDKTAATVSNKGGAQANFTISGKSMNASGTIAIKGKKFHATTAQATIWFDGKTQWTYMKNNDEVNISNPTESQLAAINPYSGKKIQEMYLTIGQKSYTPSQVRYKTAKGWTTIDIRNFKAVNLGDGMFRFNSKDFPKAEVIDLR